MNKICFKQKKLLLFLPLLFVISSVLYPQETARNVLVIHSYHQGLEWTDNVSRGIQDVLFNLDEDIEIYYEYLDTKRNPGEEYFQKISRFELEKTQMAELQFEAIIVSDNNALRFMTDTGYELFPDVPVVFCGVNDFRITMLKGHSNITGVAEMVDYTSTIAIMKKFHPQADKIMIVLDKTPTGQAIERELLQILPLFKDTFEFEFYRDFALQEVEEKLNAMDSRTLIYLLAFNKDKNNVFISYSDLIKIFYKHSHIPIYGSWDMFFGDGIVGGMITSAYLQGYEAAEMVTDILNGVKIMDIPIIYQDSNKFMFDYRELERFGISLKELPEDSLVINRDETTLLEKYKYLIFAMIFLLLNGIVLLIAFNMKHLKEKKRIQEELHALGELVPICSHCKKIRDDTGYWNNIEAFLNSHSNFSFSHGLCPDCVRELYPDLSSKILKTEKERE